MNIIRETKWALLELFPDQLETEAAAEETAWNKARQAEAQAKAEAEAKEKEAAEAAAAEGEEASGAEPEAAPMEAAEEEEIAAHQPYNPETDAVPFSEVPEGPRSNGVMVLDYRARGVHLDVQCSPEQVVEAARILDGAGFLLESVSGVDWIKEDQMEVIYDYNRTDGKFCRVAVRVRIPRAEPAVPTISDIYPGANWHERETHEFFGIRFEGHPYLVPLLLPEDADFHPLRKDFTP